MTETEILAAHPDLKQADLRACYAYAALWLKPQPPPQPPKEEPRDPNRWMTPAQFKAHLQQLGKLPPDE